MLYASYSVIKYNRCNKYVCILTVLESSTIHVTSGKNIFIFAKKKEEREREREN